VNPEVFNAICASWNLPPATPEYQFCERKWAFDFAWRTAPDGRPLFVALEIDGGAWSGGRHTRGKGFINDLEKLNAAVVMGWRVIRSTPRQVKSGEIFPVLQELLIPESQGAA
jgi:hypothetical protein